MQRVVIAALLLGFALSHASAHAYVRRLKFQINGQTYYGILVNGQRAAPDLRLSAVNPDFGQVSVGTTWTPNLRSQLTFEDLTYGSLETLLESPSLFENPENLDLLRANSDVNLQALRQVLEQQVRSRSVDMASVNREIETLLKRLIEQWIVTRYKLQRTDMDPAFFDELRRQEPLDKEGSTTLALFDGQKSIVATVTIVVRSPEHPRLDFERRVGVDVEPFQEYFTRSYPLMRLDGFTNMRGTVRVGQDAELKKFIVRPEMDHTVIPAMLYFLDSTGILSFGQSIHPAFRTPSVRDGSDSRELAIGKYYLEANKLTMRLYSRSYGFETVFHDVKSDTYVMASNRDQLLQLWKSFVPKGSTGMDFSNLIAPFKVDGALTYPSYAGLPQQALSPERRLKTLSHLSNSVENLSCELALSR